jgi:formylmethanofuran dehydrogenase subunit E
MLRDKVMTYILSQQARNIIFSNRRLEINDRLHRIAAVAQPVVLEPIDVYETLSINVENTLDILEPVQCPVCYDEISSEQKKMNCGHAFCGDCTDKLLKNSIKPYLYNNCAKCPLCRERIHTISSFVKPLNNIDFEL